MTTTIRALYLLLLSLYLVTSIPTAHAETRITLACPNFEGANGNLFKLTSDAALDASDIRLTRDTENVSGTALSKDLVFLASDGSFSTYFTFKMTKRRNPGDGGGDGLAFVLQTDLKAKPGAGGNIGYSGAHSSLELEFDTFPNTDLGDPEQHHIGVNLNGKPQSVATALSPFLLNDGRTYHVWAEYDGSAHVLEIRVADAPKRPDEPTLSHNVDLSPVLGGAAHVGFSAATGTARQEHAIQSIYFQREFVAGGLDPAKEFYVTDLSN
jgi:hypothetical protein